MTVLVPERTIDSLFAFETLAAVPRAIIFSPANNAGRMTPDHEIRVRRGRVFVFELKTLSVVANNPGWVVTVPRTQLADYVAHKPNIIYLLPAQPGVQAKPWIRSCAQDPDSNGHCIACANPGPTEPLLHARRWAGLSPYIQGQPPELLLQPWFNHWAWCVRAADLQAFLTVHNTTPPGRPSWEIDADDAYLSAIPTAERFCHLLQAMAADHGPGTVSPPPPGPTDDGSNDSPGQEPEAGETPSDQPPENDDDAGGSLIRRFATEQDIVLDAESRQVAVGYDFD
ncbi:hypothetical protein ACMYYO_11110 [Dermacoccaceae bacterium W4C1]